FHLLEGEGLKSAHVVEAAGRAEHFHPISPRCDDLPCRMNHRVRSIGHDPGGRTWRRIACDADRETRDEHAGTDHPAHVYQIAHRQIRAVRSAEISNRRDAGLERLLRVVLCEKCGDCRMPGGLGAWRSVTIPVTSDMRVGID